jgi:hypothetical protein
MNGFSPLADAHAQQLQWIRQLGTDGHDGSRGVSADSLGNVYVSGNTEGSLIGLNATGGLRAFVSKYDASGSLQWNRQLESASGDYCYGVSANSLGDVYISGFTLGSLGGPNAGYYDAFVSKFDTSGNLQWTRQLGTAGDDRSHGVSADSLGNVYISGYLEGSLDGSSAGFYAFLSKYDATGNLQWTRQLESNGPNFGNGVSADSLGNVYISGYTFGSLGGPNAGYSDAFVSKYDASGNLQWTRQLGDSSIDDSNGVSADSLGNVYISGRTIGRLDGPNSNFGSYDAFVSKYDSSGNLQWTRQLGSSSYDASNGVSADLLGNVYISGYTEGSMAAPNASGIDAFVAKYDASGSLQWTRQLESAGYHASHGVSADSRGNVYISGNTSGSLGGPNAGLSDAFVAKYSTIPEPGTLLLGTLVSVGLLLRHRR